MSPIAAAPLRRATLASLVLVGCAYRADSFEYGHERFRGVYLTIDCLDLAIDHRRSRDASVLDYQFANRCDEPALVDLAAARVYERTTDGTAIELAAYDPRREIRAGHLDGRAVGREAIEYPTTGAGGSVCIDAASIARAWPARWVCFASRR